MISLRSAALAACVAGSAPAMAADWKLAGLAIGEGNRGVTYVDASSVRHVRDKIRFRSELYLERPENGIDRIFTLSDVDCATMKVTVLRESYHSGRALLGFGQAPRETSYYSDDNSYHWVLRRVCDGEFLSSEVSDRHVDAARMFSLNWNPIPGRLSLYVPAVAERGSRMASIGSAGNVTAGTVAAAK